MEQFDLTHITKPGDLKSIIKTNPNKFAPKRCGRCSFDNYLIITHKSTPECLHVIRYTKCNKCGFTKPDYIMQFKIEKANVGLRMSEVCLKALQCAVNRNLFNETVNDIITHENEWKITTPWSTSWFMTWCSGCLVG